MRPAPPVVSQDAVARTEALLRRYVGWPADGVAADGAGGALVHAFASLVDVVAERVNGVPERNLLAFLELVGVRPAPPQAARVPLTFTLAAGASGDVVVPAGTRVAAADVAGGGEPVVFETERDAVATAARLTELWVRDPLRDRVADHGADAGRSEPFPAFGGSRWIEHVLYVAHDELLGLAEWATITLLLPGVVADAGWPAALRWERWDGDRWIDHQPMLRRTGPKLDIVELTFADFPRVPRTPVAGLDNRWLRARLPTSIPRLRGAAATAATIRRSGVVPDALRAGTADGNPHRPLTPFTTSDRRLLVRCDEAFSKPGAAVRLSVAIDAAAPPRPTPDLRLHWQWFDASWRTLGTSTAAAASGAVADSTRALTTGGSVEFVVPAGWSSGTSVDQPVGQRNGLWLLVEPIAGGYGSSPPTITSLRVAYDWPRPRHGLPEMTVAVQRFQRPLDAAFANATELDLTKDFLPFGAQPATGDVLYVACDDALTVPRESVTLSVTVTTEPKDAFGGVTPPPAVPQHGLALVWEVFDVAAQRWLDVSVTDTTDALTTSGEIVFALPDTTGATTVNGDSRPWLRVRIAQGDYGPEAASSRPQPPSIRAIAATYSYSSSTPSFAPCVAHNDFATQLTKPDAAGVITPFVASADADPALYLGFDRPFSNQAIDLYFAVRDVVGDASSRSSEADPPVVVWEFWDTAVDGWSHLEVRDETRAFTRRGLVTFVAPATLGATREFGRVAHWLRARWAQGTYDEPPQLERVLTSTTWALHRTTHVDEVLGSSTGRRDQVLRAAGTPLLDGELLEVREQESDDAAWTPWRRVVDFHGSAPQDRHYTLEHASGELRFGDGVHGRIPPAGRANVRLARYDSGGGTGGNVAADAISRLLSTLPYVDAVVNHEQAAGGIDGEGREAVVQRGPRMLRHGGRAVVAADFEDLALEASTSVERAWAIAAPSDRVAGRVGVVIVPRSAQPRPSPSRELVERVERHLRERCAATFDLWVAGPGWLRIDVEAEIVPLAPELAANLEGAVRARLRAFLHPLSGRDGDGWPLGRRLFRSDVEAVVHSVAGVDHVRVLRVAEHVVSTGPLPDAVLVSPGTQSIRIVGGPPA